MLMQQTKYDLEWYREYRMIEANLVIWHGPLNIELSSNMKHGHSNERLGVWNEKNTVCKLDYPHPQKRQYQNIPTRLPVSGSYSTFLEARGMRICAWVRKQKNDACKIEPMFTKSHSINPSIEFQSHVPPPKCSRASTRLGSRQPPSTTQHQPRIIPTKNKKNKIKKMLCTKRSCLVGYVPDIWP